MADASFEKTVRRKLAALPDIGLLPGVFVASDGVRGTVDVGGGRIPADFAGYRPEVGEDIRILIINGTATILGPAKLKSGQGTVAAPPSGNLVKVTTEAGDITVPYAAGLSLSVGQQVKLGAANEGQFVFAVMSTSPTPAAPPPPPSGGGGLQTQIFNAIDAGSYRSGNGWWTAEVYASDTNDGAFFYGSKITDTIDDAATIKSIEIFISIRKSGPQAPNWGYHGSPTKPGGNVALSGLSSIPISNGWIALPVGFADYLKANAGGVGIHQGGYQILNSLAADPQSGALRISWT